MNDRLRLNEKPESDTKGTEEFEVVRSAGNLETLMISKNTTVSSCEVKYSGISANGRFLVLSGENHGILNKYETIVLARHGLTKIDTLEDKLASTSSTMLNPVGFGLDKHDNVWVHNILNHKLLKFDSYLNLQQTWEGHETDFTQEGNTIGFNADKSVVYWYKGKHECLVIDADSNETSDTIDYLMDDVPVVKGLYGVKDLNILVVLTCNHSGEDAKIILFDLKKHKTLQKASYAKVTDNVGAKIRNSSMVPATGQLMLVGATSGDKPKSVVSMLSVPELKHKLVGLDLRVIETTGSDAD